MRYWYKGTNTDAAHLSSVLFVSSSTRGGEGGGGGGGESRGGGVVGGGEAVDGLASVAIEECGGEGDGGKEEVGGAGCVTAHAESGVEEAPWWEVGFRV